MDHRHGREVWNGSCQTGLARGYGIGIWNGYGQGLLPELLYFDLHPALSPTHLLQRRGARLSALRLAPVLTGH